MAKVAQHSSKTSLSQSSRHSRPASSPTTPGKTTQRMKIQIKSRYRKGLAHSHSVVCPQLTKQFNHKETPLWVCLGIILRNPCKGQQSQGAEKKVSTSLYRASVRSDWKSNAWWLKRTQQCLCSRSILLQRWFLQPRA